jgi:TfoX/Sxy family transcriptional regulator of competence genes
MAYDETLANRIRNLLPPVAPVIEKKMFGGIGFLLNGNMAVGVHKNDLIVRTGLENHKVALNLKGAKSFDITGRPMIGWVMVSQEGCATEKALLKWISMALDFVETLPPK